MENGFMEKRLEWCHKYCYNKALYITLNPIFSEICHEDCQDTNCSLVHEDFGD